METKHIAVLCDPDSDSERTDEVVSELDLPPCPEVLTHLLRETRSDEPDIRRVSQLIGQDAALASASLRVVNSPFYGLRAPVDTVEKAVIMLGLNAISRLVTGVLLRQAFPRACGTLMNHFWRYSMAGAMISPLICRELSRGDSGLAATFGLFRDCGMPAMLIMYPGYAQIFLRTIRTPGKPALEAEHSRYPVDHTQVGAEMARSWLLSKPLVDAVRYHHHVSMGTLPGHLGPETRFLIACGYAAERLYTMAMRIICPEWQTVADWVMGELDMEEQHFAELAKRVAENIHYL